jgi:hypothetical protein
LQDAAVLLSDFGISLQGVIDTQLLAGLVGLAAASGSSSSSSSDFTASSSAKDFIKRLRLDQLYNVYGYNYTKIRPSQRGGPG